MLNRLFNLIKGIFLHFLGKTEKNNPELLLENEKAILRNNIARFNQQLAQNAGFIEQLAAKDNAMDKEAQQLETKVNLLLEKGDKENAALFALRLQKNRKENLELEEQLKQAKEQFKELTKARDVAVQTAKEKIEKIETDLGSVKTHEALAEMNEMATGMVSTIGGTGDTINRLEKSIEERKAQAIGRSQVAKGAYDAELGTPKEDSLDAELALQEFLKNKTTK